jgi:hypothetical protein
MGKVRPSFLVMPWVAGTSLGRLLDTYVHEHPAVEWTDSIEEADVAVLPFDAAALIHQPYGPPDLHAIAYAQSFSERAERAGVPSVAVSAGDSTLPLSMKFDVVIRHSIDRGRFSRGEYCLPGWYDAAQDPTPELEVSQSPRGQKPQLGFCGQLAPLNAKFHFRPIRQKLLQLKDGLGMGSDAVDALYLRRFVVDRLAKSSVVTSNFVFRDKFYWSLPDKELALRQFVDNIEQSDYVLCVRGSGNYSFRFYDALSHGRVPVVIDTECALPFDHILDYKKLLPIIPLSQIEHAPLVIEEHYRSFSDEEWFEFQRYLRRFFLEWLTPVGFFKKLALIPEFHSRLTSSVSKVS